jgi:hypothetical protein
MPAASAVTWSRSDHVTHPARQCALTVISVVASAVTIPCSDCTHLCLQRASNRRMSACVQVRDGVLVFACMVRSGSDPLHGISGSVDSWSANSDEVH